MIQNRIQWSVFRIINDHDMPLRKRLNGNAPWIQQQMVRSLYTKLHNWRNPLAYCGLRSSISQIFPRSSQAFWVNPLTVLLNSFSIDQSLIALNLAALMRIADDGDTKLPKLLLRDIRWSTHHQVLGLLIHRE